MIMLHYDVESLEKRFSYFLLEGCNEAKMWSHKPSSGSAFHELWEILNELSESI